MSIKSVVNDDAPEEASHFISSARSSNEPSPSISGQQRQMTPSHVRDSISVNGSLDIDNVISSFDEASVGTSRQSATFLSCLLSNFTRFSSRHDTTAYDTATLSTATSFHSALADGFSLRNYVPRLSISASDVNLEPSVVRFREKSNHLLWENSHLIENESMLAKSDFEIVWTDISYEIKLKLSLARIIKRLERNILAKSIHRSVTNMLGRKDYYPDIEKDDPDTITILNRLNGSIKTGELTAVMGPSGAGKTSLLNFLSRRREDGYTGYLSVKNLGDTLLKTSTIPQNDSLPEYLNVRENLLYASRLKNTQPNYDHMRYIKQISKLLGLDACLETRTKKISGGEHKRLAIAQELLSKPDILILDEPTSGLDSMSCYKTISFLKELVEASAKKLIDPIAIVLSIHQPQREVFDLFDKIYVMASGGIAIYDGSPSNCSQYVNEITGIQMPSEDYNPASFIIEIASGEYGSEPIRALASKLVSQRDLDSQHLLNDKAKQSGVKSPSDICSTHSDIEHDGFTLPNLQNSKSSQALNQLDIDSRIAKASSFNSGSFWYKTRILLGRCWTSVIRDPKQVISRILFHIIVPLGLVTVMGSQSGKSNACPRYFNQISLKKLFNDDLLTSEDVQEELLVSFENLALYFSLIYTLTAGTIGILTVSFTYDFMRSLKEFYNGWYSMTSYLIARIASELPMLILLPALSIAIVYPLTSQYVGHGAPESFRIFIITMGSILAFLICLTIGMIFGAIYMNQVGTALFMSQGSTIPMVFLSGFVVKTKGMSKLIYLLSYGSFLRHTLEIIMVGKYGFDVCNCDPKSINQGELNLTGVPDRLKNAIDYYASISSADDDSQDNLNGTSSDNQDIFQFLAKQILLYNTYGVNIRTCDDMQPYQMQIFNLKDRDMPYSFMALLIYLIVLQILLFVTVKCIICFKRSL